MAVSLSQMPLSEFKKLLADDEKHWDDEDVNGIRWLRMTGLMDLGAAACLDYITEYVHVCKLPMEQRYKDVEDLKVKLEELKFELNFFAMMIPAMDRAVELEVLSFARLRAARTAIVVRRFGLAYGRYPETLDELVPEYLEAVMVDPIDGQALRYRIVDNGFVVYSIGDNGIDDGGQDDDEPGTGDVAFRMERGLGMSK